jgi:phage tail-like protein
MVNPLQCKMSRVRAAVITLAAVLLAGEGAAQQTDPIVAARFELSIDGHSLGVFSELSGITTEIEAVDYVRSSSRETTYKKLPGKNKPPTLTLKRGHTASLDLWALHEAARTGESSAVKSGDLTAYDAQGQVVARYHLVNAWPSKIEISTLPAGASQQLYESVTITCDHIQRIAP